MNQEDINEIIWNSTPTWRKKQIASQKRRSKYIKDCYEYAKDLATYLWKNHFQESAPDWEPLPDLFGVLSQIDNMIAHSTENCCKECVFKKT